MIGDWNRKEIEGRTTGLFLNDRKAFNGYTLFGPLNSTTTYLIDNAGEVVHTWEGLSRSSGTTYLLEDGNLLYSGRADFDGPLPMLRWGGGGRVLEMTWDGTPVWEFEYSDDMHLLHHDTERLPNGNTLMIVWEIKTAEEAIAAGRDPDSLFDVWLVPDFIVEVKPTGAAGGEIVWEWHVWDHLIQDYDSSKANFGVVADHPELIDINFDSREGSRKGQPDFTHMNSVDYNEELDQIVLSVRMFSEIWIIDHSTTTEEAAGHTGGNSGKGGDLLYRWGNPQTYRAGNASDQRFFKQHDAQWVEDGLPGVGNILVFNNGGGRYGVNRSASYSSIDEIVPPLDSDGNYVLTSGTYEPQEQLWIYTSENRTSFYSPFISGVQRLPNGNTLACAGIGGLFLEVTPEKEVVWKYINPFVDNAVLNQKEPIPEGRQGKLNDVFTIRRYSPDYSGLVDKV